jgi:hypothetical protein
MNIRRLFQDGLAAGGAGHDNDGGVALLAFDFAAPIFVQQVGI